jgi:DNA primase
MRSPSSDEGITVEELREQTDIIEVVRQYVPSLQKAGRDWKGLCPFHLERTPSFYVIPHQRRFFCFGCRAGGDAMRFIMDIDRVSFPEACDRLAQRLGRRFHGKESAERRSQRDTVLDLNGEAARFWAEILARSERADEARAYIARRGIAAEIVESFRLGYSLPEWDALGATFRGRGRSEALLLEAGLLKPRDEGSGSYDRFRGRLMFPIRSSQGDVVGFGGRVLGDEQPKYLNSPATSVFDKSRTLYGFPQAGDGLKAEGWALVVEGYTDVLACQQAGVRNAVATLGTSLTADHLSVLKRYVQRVVMAYDADSAGLNAMIRSAADLEESGLEVAALVLPQGEDPDSLLRRDGPDALRAALDKAVPLYHFVLDRLLPHGQEAITRQQVRNAVEAISRVQSATTREQHVLYAADRLGLGDAQRASAMASAVRQEVAAALKERGRAGHQDRTAPDAGRSTGEVAETLLATAGAQVPVGTRRREEVILMGLAQETVRPEEVFRRVSPHLFADPIHRELASRAEELYRSGARIAEPGFLEGLSAEAAHRWSQFSVGDEGAPQESVEDCIGRLLDGPKEARLAELQRSVPLILAKPEHSEEEQAALLEYQELLRYFMELAGQRTAGR